MYGFSSRLASLVPVSVDNFTCSKSSSKSFKKLQENFEEWVYILLLEKSSKVIKSLMSIKVNNVFNIGILL